MNSIKLSVGLGADMRLFSPSADSIYLKGIQYEKLCSKSDSGPDVMLHGLCKSPTRAVFILHYSHDTAWYCFKSPVFCMNLATFFWHGGWWWWLFQLSTSSAFGLTCGCEVYLSIPVYYYKGTAPRMPFRWVDSGDVLVIHNFLKVCNVQSSATSNYYLPLFPDSFPVLLQQAGSPHEICNFLCVRRVG